MTAVLIRESWLSKANKDVPTMLRYATHVKNNSLYNTPPTFGVYVLGLVLQWIEKAGGLTGDGGAQRPQGAGRSTTPSTAAAASTAATRRRSRARR